MKFSLILLLLGTFFIQSNGKPLDETFGYVDVRPGAHMFWVMYETERDGNWTEAPLVLWLQGGPGGSSTGIGNFQELGPYNIDGKLRPYRWTKQVNLMFVDNPVGSGYSYVDDYSKLCTDGEQISNDLLTMLKEVFNEHPVMKTMPFFIFSESYGGKMTAEFALVLDTAIKNEEISCNFQGIALGDSWISPMDSVNTWATFLYNMGYVTTDGFESISKAASNTQKAVDEENWSIATNYWSQTEGIVSTVTGGVNFYNVLAVGNHKKIKSNVDNKFEYLSTDIRQLYVRHVLGITSGDLPSFMNGPQATAWNIPKNVNWGSQSGLVFDYLKEDFMKPVVNTVSKLLNDTNLHVSVYTGNLDLICDSPGTYEWIKNMYFAQKHGYEKTDRTALHITSYSSVAAFVRRYDRFSVFTHLRSGHMLPSDVPESAFNMVEAILNYGDEAQKNLKTNNKPNTPQIQNNPYPDSKEESKKVQNLTETQKSEIKSTKMGIKSLKSNIRKNVKKNTLKVNNEDQIKANRNMLLRNLPIQPVVIQQ